MLRLQSLVPAYPENQPSLRDLRNAGLEPTVETVGYYQLSLRDKRLRATG